ncbi:hypothetical protein [Halomonas alimentaria]|uniref:Uncharacterized protein n=1 Tax=Halomonas alimentaria TaxID=147248 RepID=A0A7X4W600_9GAMM|nr:hypothetical protein [Halomonas alimentaria]NAW35017.1 hypothetical protein [Halomonas alimentaria]
MPNLNQHSDDLRLDPWLKQPENRVSVPDDAELACLQEINLGGVDIIPEALFFRRHDGQDELWAAGLRHGAPGKPRDVQLASAYKQGRVAWASSQGTRSTGAEILFRALTAARHGHVWPEDFLEGPLITEATHCQILGELQAEIDRNTREAGAQAGTEIIELARRLGLRPEPAGRSPSAWYANCPGKSHRLMISSNSNQFGCGYCRVKGGAAELEALAQERKQINSPTCNVSDDRTGSGGKSRARDPMAVQKERDLFERLRGIRNVPYSE